MRGPLPVDFLQPEERPLRRDRRHPASLVAPWAVASLLWMAALAGATFIGLRLPDLWLSVGLPLAMAATVVLGTYLAASWLRCTSSLYLLTPERVYRATGRLRFHLLQTTYDKITDLHVRQGPLGRANGFGTVRLETAGAGITLPGIRDPFGFKRDAEGARTAFLATLVAEHRRKGRQAKSAFGVPAPAPAGEALWQGGPSVHSLVGRLLVAGFFAAAGAGSLVVALASSGQMLLPGLLFLGLAFTQAIGGLLHFQYTRYEVTGRGVSVNRGWLTKRRIETTFEKVTDVTTSQGLLGRMLDYGVIRINTAGASAAAVVFEGLADPERIKRVVDDARSQAGHRG